MAMRITRIFELLYFISVFLTDQLNEKFQPPIKGRVQVQQLFYYYSFFGNYPQNNYCTEWNYKHYLITGFFVKANTKRPNLKNLVFCRPTSNRYSTSSFRHRIAGQVAFYSGITPLQFVFLTFSIFLNFILYIKNVFQFVFLSKQCLYIYFF